MLYDSDIDRALGISGQCDPAMRTGLVLDAMSNARPSPEWVHRSADFWALSMGGRMWRVNVYTDPVGHPGAAELDGPFFEVKREQKVVTVYE